MRYHKKIKFKKNRIDSSEVKNIMNRFIAIAFMLLVVSCKDNIKINSEFLIEPGEGVGKYKLGEKLLDSNYNKNELEFFLNDKNSIINIGVLSNKYHTAKNIRIGDHYEKVLKAYGESLQEPVILKGKATNQASIKKPKIPRGLWYKKIAFDIDTTVGVIKKISLYKFEGEWPW